MEIKEKLGAIEAVLFASGEPVEFDRLAQAADVELSTLHKLVSMLNSNLSERDSAIEILRLDETYQLATKKQFAPFIRTKRQEQVPEKKRPERPVTEAALPVRPAAPEKKALPLWLLAAAAAIMIALGFFLFRG